MSHADEVWLVAGGEPGARRFGQLVQRLRKDTKWSVAELASRADLSIGTIRAIEQGRRAPSEVTGVKLLDQLLPGALQPTEGAIPDTGPMRLDYVFTDPQSGARVGLQFKARTAGDNRRWSADQPRAGESKAEALIRELMSHPEHLAEWLPRFRQGTGLDSCGVGRLGILGNTPCERRLVRQDRASACCRLAQSAWNALRRCWSCGTGRTATKLTSWSLTCGRARTRSSTATCPSPTESTESRPGCGAPDDSRVGRSRGRSRGTCAGHGRGPPHHVGVPHGQPLRKPDQ